MTSRPSRLTVEAESVLVDGRRLFRGETFDLSGTSLSERDVSRLLRTRIVSEHMEPIEALRVECASIIVDGRCISRGGYIKLAGSSLTEVDVARLLRVGHVSVARRARPKSTVERSE